MADIPEVADTPAAGDRPVALVASVWLGAVGAALIVAGFASGVEGIVVSGVAAGTLSLIAVLIWRSQLIDAWRHRTRGNGE